MITTDRIDAGIDVVVGGGISGLVAALVLAEQHGRRVALIEREPEVGGLLRSFDYGEHGRFDYGMHTMFDTGVADLDQLLFGLLPEDEWQVGEGIHRDLAGVYFGGKLQTNSPYIDLRSLPSDQYERCVGGFFANLPRNGSIDESNARAYAESRFGRAIADVITPVIEKFYGKDASLMDLMATKITPFDRVVMFDEPLMSDLMQSDLLRSRLAYPEQRNLPAARGSGRRTYYPRRYGIDRVVAALRERLERAGVDIRTGAEVRRIDIENGCVTAVDTGSETIPVDRLYWSSGLPPLARALGTAMPGRPDPPRRTAIVSILLDAPLPIDLHYFYCYEAGFRTFRLTNFTAYSSGAPRGGKYPITMELLVDDAEAKDVAGLERRAGDELRAFGVLSSGTEVTFMRAEVLAAGFPMPSCNAVRVMNQLRTAIAERDLRNLTTMGVLSEPGLFFQRDVLADTYRKVAA